MATLHIVNKAAALEACLPLMADGDALLLIEDGVYAARRHPTAPGTFHALESDLKARGLVGRIDATFQVVSYDGFLSLVEQHQPIVTWSR